MLIYYDIDTQSANVRGSPAKKRARKEHIKKEAKRKKIVYFNKKKDITDK